MPCSLMGPPSVRHIKLGVHVLNVRSYPGRPIAAFIFAIAVYLSCSIPAIRTVVTPVEGVDSPEDQVQAMQLVSAGNVIMLGLLGLVIALQVRGPRGMLRCSIIRLLIFFLRPRRSVRSMESGRSGQPLPRWRLRSGSWPRRRRPSRGAGWIWP